MDTFIKKFSIIFFILFMMIWMYFLWIQKIKSWELAMLMIVTSISTLLLYNIENIKKLFLKSPGYEVGAEWEKAKKEVNAKAEEVKKMGEDIAETVAFSITRLGRFAPKDLDKQLVEHRNKLTTMLKNIGSGKEKIEEITEQINRVVVNDLEGEVIKVVNNTVKEKITQIEIKNKIVEEMRQEDALPSSVHFSDQIIINRIVEKIRQYFKSYELNETKNELTEYLKSIGCYSTAIEERLDRYEYFLKNKKLK